MKSLRLRCLRNVVFGSFVLAGLACSSIAEAQNAVPFKVSVTINEQIVPVPSDRCPVAQGFINGSGTLTIPTLPPISVSISSTDCILPTRQGTGTTFVFSSSDAVIIRIDATNEEIHATYQGAFKVDPGGACSGMGVIQGGFSINGGSGRFANARGGGTLSGMETVDTCAGNGTGPVELSGVATGVVLSSTAP